MLLDRQGEKPYSQPVNSRLTYLLFDLDETLYPSSSGLTGEISRRMTRYVSRYLEVDEASAAQLRRRLSLQHGTTLGGLINEYGFREPESYLRFAHPTDVRPFLHKDPELIEALDSIALPKSILTNAPEEHARRILSFLEIGKFFERIFDIRTNDFMGKPETEVYLRVLAELNREASEILFIDNRIDYLLGFRKLGGQVLWLAEAAAQGDSHHGIDRIAHVKDLPAYLDSL